MFIYITRLASKEIFSPSIKIHREVGRVKDLSAPRLQVFVELEGQSGSFCGKAKPSSLDGI